MAWVWVAQTLEELEVRSWYAKKVPNPLILWYEMTHTQSLARWRTRLKLSEISGSTNHKAQVAKSEINLGLWEKNRSKYKKTGCWLSKTTSSQEDQKVFGADCFAVLEYDKEESPHFASESIEMVCILFPRGALIRKSGFDHPVWIFQKWMMGAWLFECCYLTRFHVP